MLIELSVKFIKEGGTEPWIWSFFGKAFHQELVNFLCIGAYFESWARHVRPPLSISQTLKNKLRLKLGTCGMPHHWGVVNEPCVVASMVHPDHWSTKANPRASMVLGGGGARVVLATKAGWGHASCPFSGRPTLGCRARRLGRLGGLGG